MIEVLKLYLERAAFKIHLQKKININEPNIEYILGIKQILPLSFKKVDSYMFVFRKRLTLLVNCFW